MTVLLWIALGVLAGWLTSIATATPPEGRLANLVVGIIGALVGGVVLQIFGASGGGFDATSLLTAVLGAAILIGLIRHVHRPVI